MNDLVLRRCLVNGKPATFHTWTEKCRIFEPNGIPGGEVIRELVAVVEFEDGIVKLVSPNAIQFIDKPSMKKNEFLTRYMGEPYPVTYKQGVDYGTGHGCGGSHMGVVRLDESTDFRDVKSESQQEYFGKK